jgi:hypothetical protein
MVYKYILKRNNRTIGIFEDGESISPMLTKTGDTTQFVKNCVASERKQ